MEDSLILELLWSRADNAIAALTRKFGPRLLRTARNMLGPEDAEECVNDTYLAVWNAIPPRRPEPLTPFVLRVGRNIALNRLRSLGAQKRSGYALSLEELSGCIPAAPRSDPELGQVLQTYLAGLSRENRALFLRRYWFGDPVREIARDLALTENAASVRLSRMREGLRRHLTQEGYDL